MKVLARLFLGLLLLIAAFALFLVVSVAVDGWVGRERVAALTNTPLPSIGEGRAEATLAYVARPSTPGPHPAVIMLHEFWGLKPELLGKADALAAEGYVVVAPDMFRGQTTSWLPRAIFLALSVPEPQALAEIDPALRWLQAQPDVDPSRIVVMGFCYGGGKALQYSLRTPEVAGTGVFYGALTGDPAQLSRLPGPVLGIFGAEDQAPSPAQVADFQLGLAAAGVEHEITVYDGVGHAFLTDMAAIRQGGVQGQAWGQFVAWLDRVSGTN